MSAKNWIYVCHPYRSDPVGNSEKVREICSRLKNTYILIAPQLFLDSYMDEATERNRIMEVCLGYVERCDGLLICGDTISDGMRGEIQRASSCGIPIYSNVTEMLFRTGHMDCAPPRCVHKETGI